MKKVVLATLLGVLCCAFTVQAQNDYDPRITRIGDEFAVNVQTTHPYNTSNTDGYVFEKEFTSADAGYVRLHFKNFDLAPGDYVEVFSPNTGESYVYSEGGKVVWAETRKTINEFWANAIWDNTAVVRLYAKDASSHYGFDIDVVAYGYSEARLAKIFDREIGRTNTVCGANDMDEAICHQGTDMYTKAQAVCRLLMNGSGLCTGWLVGSEGHVMTNNHCIGNSSTAQNTDFLFDYEYSSCSGTGAQSGTLVANTSTLVKTSGTYDYTLVKLPSNPTSTYGYLSMSSSGPSVGDRIYIPQHPGGVRKKLAVTDDQSPYSGNIAAIRSLSSNRTAYYADTQGGSSGSPVLDYNSNLVVVLHNTGSCSSGNGGIPIANVINDLGGLVPTNGVDNSGGGGGGGNCYDGATAISSFPYSESFESGIGAWEQASCDQINWTRDSGGTPSSNTGPSSGSAGSWYMYVEASSPNYPGVSSDIYATFNLGGESQATFSFDYHSYGTANDVSLKLEASTDGSNWTTVWSMTGNKGNQWNSESVNLNSYAGSTVTLRFAAVTGNTWQGDVAVDNLALSTTGGGGGGGNCGTVVANDSFESASGSIWSNAGGDDLDWTRDSGGTPSSGTGPSTGYDGSYYMYVEVSGNGTGYPNKYANLATTLNLSNATCANIDFAYHIYSGSGYDIGDLWLQVSTNGGSSWSTLWNVSTSQGDQWNTASVDLGAYAGSTIGLRFRGGSGSSWQSDFAIDAVRVTSDNGTAEIAEAIAEGGALQDVDEMTLFPNPASQVLNIGGVTEEFQFQVMDKLGRVVMSGTGNTVDISTLQPDVYYLRGDGVVKTFLKQ